VWQPSEDSAADIEELVEEVWLSAMMDEPNNDRRKRNLVPILSDVSKGLSPDNVRRFYSAAFEHLNADIFKEQREQRALLEEMNARLINFTCPTEFVCDFKFSDLVPIYENRHKAWDDPERPKDVLTFLVWCWCQFPLTSAISLTIFILLTLDNMNANRLSKKYGVPIEYCQQVIQTFIKINKRLNVCQLFNQNRITYKLSK